MLDSDVETEEQAGVFWEHRFTPSFQCESPIHATGTEHADGGPIWWWVPACECADEWQGYRCEAFRQHIRMLEDRSIADGRMTLCPRGHLMPGEQRAKFTLVYQP